MGPDAIFNKKRTLNVAGRLIGLSVPKVMGILNLTPDSFYDGGRHSSTGAALRQTEKMLAEGADFIDIGAYSSRPKAQDIPPAEEAGRLLPVLRAISKEFPHALISVDTFRSQVAEAAIGEGAHIINDISGGGLDAGMFNTVARLKVPYILMHMKGSPQTMLREAQYEDVFMDVLDHFVARTAQLKALGVNDVILDPGFGFAKTKEQSFQLLNKLDQFKLLGLPVLVGVSRKSMLYSTLGTTASKALNATTAANAIALMKGADLLRVHDVKEAVEAVKIVSAIVLAQQGAC